MLVPQRSKQARLIVLSQPTQHGHAISLDLLPQPEDTIFHAKCEVDVEILAPAQIWLSAHNASCTENIVTSAMAFVRKRILGFAMPPQWLEPKLPRRPPLIQCVLVRLLLRYHLRGGGLTCM